MKPYALPMNIAALLVLILAPWANSSFAKSQVTDHLADRQARIAHTDLDTTLQSLGAIDDEGQIDLAPDPLLSEPPHAAYLEDEAGTALALAAANGCRDLGLYLSYLRERGPPS